jgi:hypothetical protein
MRSKIRPRWLALPLALVAAFLPGQTVFSVDTKGNSIRNVLSLLDHGSPPPLQLVGMLTSEPIADNNGEILAFVQDRTAGISLISTNGVLTHGRFRRGDILKIAGRPRRSLGTDQILVDNVQLLGSVAAPSAPHIQVSDALSGRYPGELVTIEGNVLPVDQSLGIRLRDKSGTIVINAPVEIPLTKEILEQCIEGGRARVTGVVATRADAAGASQS